MPFFFVLSGEHATLPSAELKAILEAEGIAYKEQQTLPQVLRLNSTANAVEAVKTRSALTRVCCQELFSSEASFPEIVKAANAASLENLLQPSESFVVRVRRVREAAKNLTSMNLERKLGELVLSKIDGSRVSLKHPQKTFFGTITEDRFLFGLKLAEVSPTPFMQRRPRKRPFFHPSAMTAKLARCMVNLAGPKRGDTLLDPFCGTGSFLIEAGLLGCRVIGSDAKRYMVRGSLRNLKFFHVAYYGLTAADAKNLPITKVDCIVTDPPYGRSASTMGYTTKQILCDFLTEAADRLSTQQRICLAAPKKDSIHEMVEELGFKRVESHFVYVHRSLTREIMVLERT